MSADPIAALRAVLLADTAVAALIATRCYGGEIPEKQAKLMPQACVVLKPSGGFGGNEGYLQHGKQRIDVFAYGSTLLESWTVYLAVYTALKQMQSQVAEHVLLHSAEPLSKGAQGRDPETQWPLTLSSWSVYAAEVAAA